MLYKMLEVGDVIQTSDGSIHTITDINDNIAHYSRKYRDCDGKLVNDCFIARFNTNGAGKITYNNRVTLVDKV